MADPTGGGEVNEEQAQNEAQKMLGVIDTIPHWPPPAIMWVRGLLAADATGGPLAVAQGMVHDEHNLNGLRDLPIVLKARIVELMMEKGFAERLLTSLGKLDEPKAAPASDGVNEQEAQKQAERMLGVIDTLPQWPPMAQNWVRGLLSVNPQTGPKDVAEGMVKDDMNLNGLRDFPSAMKVRIVEIMMEKGFAERVTTNMTEFDKKKAAPTIRRIMSIARPDWQGIIIGLIISFISVLPEPLSPYFFSQAVGAVSEGWGAVCYWMYMIIACCTCGSVLATGRGYIFGMVGERMVLRMRQMLFEAIIKQDVHTMSTKASGEYISRMTADINNIQVLFEFSGVEAFTNLVSGTVIFIVMMSISWQLTLVGFGCALLSAGVLIPMGKWMGQFVAAYQTELSKALSILGESLTSFTTVRSFAAERYTEIRFKKVMGDLSKARCWWMKEKSVYRLALIRTCILCMFFPFATFFYQSVIYGSLWYALYLCIQGQFSTGLIFSFIFYSTMLQAKMGAIGGIIGQFESAKVGATEIFIIMDSKPSIPIRGGKRPDSMIGEVVFENVHFSYPKTDAPVLTGLNVRVPPQTSAAFVGMSGVGKSTTLRLLERFYDVTGGSVMIDGNDVRELDGCWLRRKLAFVQQEPSLFDMSIRENVAYSYMAAVADRAGDDDTVSMTANALTSVAVDDGAPLQDKIEAACKLANAHNFIEALEKGYDSDVGEGGTKLSGGQKQRVAIARAILSDPSIMLLDEATSALDSESEALVQQAINNMMKGRTVLMVAHRLSTVKEATAIHFMKAGAVEASGPFEELLQKSPGFADLVAHQLT